MIIENILNDPEKILVLTDHAAATNGIHRNSSNYLNFEERLPNYKAFHILKEEDRILSFAGIYKDPLWPEGILRVVDRMFTFPEFRVKNMDGFSNNKPGVKNSGGLCSGQLLPFQTKLVLEWGLNPFFSIQDLERRKGVERWIKKFKDIKYA